MKISTVFRALYDLFATQMKYLYNFVTHTSEKIFNRILRYYLEFDCHLDAIYLCDRYFMRYYRAKSEGRFESYPDQKEQRALS